MWEVKLIKNKNKENQQNQNLVLLKDQQNWPTLGYTKQEKQTLKWLKSEMKEEHYNWPYRIKRL